MKKITTKFIVQGAIIAALYCALTIFLAPISYGYMQVRVSEALTVLAFFTSAAVPGLFIGCLLANILGGLGILDIIFGSLATLLAAYLTNKIKSKWLAPLPPVIINAFIIGLLVAYYLNIPSWVGVVSVGAGQAIACYALGLPLILILEKRKDIFKV